MNRSRLTARHRQGAGARRAMVVALAVGLLGTGCRVSPAASTAPSAVAVAPTATASTTSAPRTRAPHPTGSTGLPLLRNGPMAAGDYQFAVGPDGWDACYDENPECVETPGSKTISLTLTLPSGWEGFFEGSALFPAAPRGHAAPDGVNILFIAGGYLHEDPCLQVMHANPKIPVDPTSVDSFVDALVAHPLLNVSEPKAISLGGFEGKYLEVTAPESLSGCVAYRPWEPGLYMQGPLNRWPLWVVDVDGTRVTVMGWDFPASPAADRAELVAIVNSIQFIP